MDSSFVAWLDAVGTTAFAWSLGAFVAINGVAAALFVLKRDRAVVNKWTGRVLAVDLLLVGTGIGVPVVASLTSAAVSALTTQVAGASIAGVRSVEMDASK
jgi:hypothetical protein